MVSLSDVKQADVIDAFNTISRYLDIFGPHLHIKGANNVGKRLPYSIRLDTSCFVGYFF